MAVALSITDQSCQNKGFIGLEEGSNGIRYEK
jgi:hypothetical protein